MAFRAITSSFDVQCHTFILAFRATFTFLVRRSKPLCQVGVQSHGFGSTFRVITSSFRLAFRATFSTFKAGSSIWCSEPHFHFEIRASTFFIWCLKSLFIFHLAFRATFSFQRPNPCFFRPSEPHFHFGVQSRIFSLVFRAAFSFRHQTYHLFRLVFRATFSFRHPDPCFFRCSEPYFHFGV